MTSLMMKSLQDPKYYIIVSVFLVFSACNCKFFLKCNAYVYRCCSLYFQLLSVISLFLECLSCMHQLSALGTFPVLI